MVKKPLKKKGGGWGAWIRPNYDAASDIIKIGSRYIGATPDEIKTVDAIIERYKTTSNTSGKSDFIKYLIADLWQIKNDDIVEKLKTLNDKKLNDAIAERTAKINENVEEFMIIATDDNELAIKEKLERMKNLIKLYPPQSDFKKKIIIRHLSNNSITKNAKQYIIGVEEELYKTYRSKQPLTPILLNEQPSNNGESYITTSNLGSQIIQDQRPISAISSTQSPGYPPGQSYQQPLGYPGPPPVMPVRRSTLQPFGSPPGQYGGSRKRSKRRKYKTKNTRKHHRKTAKR
jgi:hypothetical protein